MRSRVLMLLVLGLLAALVAWIARHTYWDEATVPMPLKGEAARNPFYAAQRFLETLGARTSWDRSLGELPAGSVLVVSSWHWSLNSQRRERLEHWVQSGGRLVVDRTLLGDEEEFEIWSGIAREYVRREDKEDGDATPSQYSPCRELRASRFRGSAAPHEAYSVCGLGNLTYLASHRRPQWALRDTLGMQVLRVPVGRGSVTAINASPFHYRDLFEGDHGALLIAATQMRAGDDIHFLSEDNHPSILKLLWKYGAPVVVLALVIIALALWRGGVRFGPLAAPPDPARRSLGEQILGTGRFALRFGGGMGLHAAAVRALNEAAQRQIPGWPRMTAPERIAALAQLAGLETQELAAAMNLSGSRRTHELRDALMRLESARRTISISNRRSRYANGIQYGYAGS